VKVIGITIMLSLASSRSGGHEVSLTQGGAIWSVANTVWEGRTDNGSKRDRGAAGFVATTEINRHDFA